jgi:ribonucleoside-diphosphate reductase alpha chain
VENIDRASTSVSKGGVFLSIELSSNARTVLEKRYLRKKDDGTFETPEEMFYRVAYNIAEADKLYDKKANIKKKAERFYELMTSLKFMPNSPTLMVRQDS